MIDISRALAVPGYMSEGELTYLATLVSEFKWYDRICEVGSYKGRSSVAIAANTAADVYCVDTWGEFDHSEELTDESRWSFDQWQKNTRGLKNIYPVNHCSLFAARDYARNAIRFSMVFIDADHNLESVKADIAAWGPLVKKGGILCGHDYTPAWPGVIEAVDAMVPKFRVVESIWTTEGCE